MFLAMVEMMEKLQFLLVVGHRLTHTTGATDKQVQLQQICQRDGIMLL